MTVQLQTEEKSIFWGLFSALVLGAVLLAPSRGEAKGFMLITYGDDISKVADIPPQILENVKQSTGATSPEIGYKYSNFGIFFLNLWTWGGDYVIFENDTYWDLGATFKYALVRLGQFLLRQGVRGRLSRPAP